MPAPNLDLPPFDPSRSAPVKRALISVSDKSRLSLGPYEVSRNDGWPRQDIAPDGARRIAG